MRTVLISTYDLGRQPFGLASPAAWLRRAGAEVTCLDLAVQPFEAETVAGAGLVCFYLPMHTATRLTVPLIEQVRTLNPAAHLCCYGLYAPLNAELLYGLGVGSLIGGEFEGALVELYQELLRSEQPVQQQPQIRLERLAFQPPERSGLPSPDAYSRVVMPDGTVRTTGYTEASRGCKHLCRHCPVVPVYNGRFRVVPVEVVLEDICRQVAAGAQHITFGDPDFFNGPAHALRIVEALQATFPGLSYDVTIKVEHLLAQARHLPRLRETGCLFVTSAVEAVDDAILARFAKQHTRADFVRATELCREAGLTFNPTFVTFTPWTTVEGYLDLLQTIATLGLVEHVAPIQYAIRLLIPAGSRLLELEEVRRLVGPFDEQALCYPWRHLDPAVDQLYFAVFKAVQASQGAGESRANIFGRIRALAIAAAGAPGLPEWREGAPRALVPHLSEPWYC